MTTNKHLRALLIKILVLFTLTLNSTLAVSNSNEVHVVLQNHIFIPATVVIPAHQKIKLIIENKDTTPEEFDSFDLNREKVIFPNRQATIYISPLPPGDYQFFGEYNPNTAKGTITVVDAKDNDPVEIKQLNTSPAKPGATNAY